MWRARVALAALALFAAAAAYEAAVALEWVSIGHEPGDGAPAESVFLVGALVAVAASLVLAVRPPRGLPFAALPVAAAAWVVANFYTFDTYYLPTRIRFSEVSGGIAAWWVYMLLAVSFGVAALILWRRGPGAGLLALFVLVCLGTVIGEGIGH